MRGRPVERGARVRWLREVWLPVRRAGGYVGGVVWIVSYGERDERRVVLIRSLSGC